MSYREVKSQLVRKLIEGTSWENKAQKEYVDTIIILETFILKGPGCMAGAMMYADLRKKYPKEWENIYEELKPEQFVRLKERERQEAEESERRREQERKESEREEKHLKKEWLEMGGKE